MRQTEEIIESLLKIRKLQKLVECKGLSYDEVDALRAEAAELRRGVPPFVLDHFDRLEETGKSGISQITPEGKCSACGEKIPADEIEYIKKNRNIGVCDSCFTFLYL